MTKETRGDCFTGSTESKPSETIRLSPEKGEHQRDPRYQALETIKHSLAEIRGFLRVVEAEISAAYFACKSSNPMKGRGSAGRARGCTERPKSRKSSFTKGGCARIPRHQYSRSWEAVLFIILLNIIVFAVSAYAGASVESENFEPSDASNARELAAATPQECPAGRIPPSSGQGPCVWNCSKPGHFLNLRLRQCSPCKPGTFDPLG